MTKQEERYVLDAFGPFSQTYEERGFDTRKFSCEQCMDFYKAFRIAMNSDSEDMKDAAMEAGKSAYHYLTHGDIEIGDGEQINNSYLVGIPGPKPFESFPLDQQQDLFYELAKGVRIKEQINTLKRSGNVLKKAAAMEDVPQNSRQWDTVCEAVRIDEALQDPGHFLSKTLAFERPGNLEKVMKSRQDALHEYLGENGLPQEYEALKTHAESIIGEPVKELVDLQPKTQWDVPFDRICTKAYEDGMQINPYDAIRSTIREAWLIDRMEPGDKKNELIESFFQRAYDTIHYEEHIQMKERQNLQFPSGLDKELKSNRSFANMRVNGSVKNAKFLEGYEAYEQKRDKESITLTDDDLKSLDDIGHTNAI